MGKEKDYLCKCNNCDTILLDQNPQINQPLVEVPKVTLGMVQLEDEGGFFWACPKCSTDSFLKDVLSEDDL